MKGPKQKAVTLRNSLIYCQKLLRNYLNALNLTKSENLYFKCVNIKRISIFFQKSLLLLAFDLFNLN